MHKLYTSFNEKTAGKKNNLCQGRALNNHALRFKNHFVNENYYEYYIKTIWLSMNNIWKKIYEHGNSRKTAFILKESGKNQLSF